MTHHLWPLHPIRYYARCTISDHKSTWPSNFYSFVIKGFIYGHLQIYPPPSAPLYFYSPCQSFIHLQESMWFTLGRPSQEYSHFGWDKNFSAPSPILTDLLLLLHLILHLIFHQIFLCYIRTFCFAVISYRWYFLSESTFRIS